MDKHPERIEIEIDRQKLKNCLIAKFSFVWAILMCMALSLGAINACHEGSDSGMLRGLEVFGYWIVGSLAGCVVGYFLFTHRRVARAVRDLSLSVEGSHLRVRTYELGNGQWHDRKLHFKVIVDYDVVEDRWMRRFGIQTLCLHTLGGGLASTITIPGVKDCEKVRDLLTELDHERENS